MKMELKQTNTVLRGNDLSQSASWFGRRNKKAMKGARVLVVALAVLAGLLTQVVRAQSETRFDIWKSGPSEDHKLSFFQIAFRHLGIDAVRDPDCDPPRLRPMIWAEHPDNT